MTLDEPGKKAAVKAKSWKKLKGSVKDQGANASGPKDVSASVVVKTAKGQWKFFNGKKWKNAKTKKQAFAKAKVLKDTTRRHRHVEHHREGARARASSASATGVRTRPATPRGKKTVTQKITK